MRACRKCGTEVEDKVYICPNCGSEIVGSTGGLTLKAAENKKTVANPMGTTVSTGSGLTDILRGDEDDEVEMQGSIPTTLARNVINEDYSGKKNNARIKKLIARIIFLAVVAVGAYFLITNVFMKEKGAKSYEDAIQFYVDAVNEKDQARMELIMPPYISATSNAAEVLDGMKNATISSFEITDKSFLSKEEKEALQDSIKYQTTKTANLENACIAKVQLTGEVDISGVKKPVVSTIEMELVQIRGYWYLHVDTYSNTDFDYN